MTFATTALLFWLTRAPGPAASTPATPAPAPAPITVELGLVRARVSCRWERDSVVLCAPTLLEVFREGYPVHEDALEGVGSYLARLPGRPPLAVRDLDGDGEPEVLLDLYSGGAHCCWSTWIYHLVGRSLAWGVLRHDWGNAGYRLEELDGGGRLDFVSADDRFSYAFTSYAASRRPPRVWHYAFGKLSDVTRKHPGLLEEDAASCWNAFEELSPKDPKGDDVRGLAAAYVADQCLLGRCREGWARLREAYDKPDREKFFGELSSFLEKNGYVGPR
ncbi:MAG: hypothetical protein ACRD3M_09915 [Thermoanaerobaculia bacterium]